MCPFGHPVFADQLPKMGQMEDYVTFEAQVVAMPWGTSVYTVVPLEPEILSALGKTARVEGELNDHPVNLAIAKAPADIIETPFLWAGKSLLRAIGVEPGELFEARLRPVSSDVVEVPSDVISALRSHGLSEVWEALTPGKRRGLLYKVESAKRAETRQKRIGALMDALRA